MPMTAAPHVSNDSFVDGSDKRKWTEREGEGERGRKGRKVELTYEFKFL